MKGKALLTVILVALIQLVAVVAAQADTVIIHP